LKQSSKKKTEFAKQTLSEKALNSKNHKKFEKKWIEKITKQLNAFVKTFSKLSNVPDLDKIKLPKIETFYSFKDLEKDLAIQAKPGVDVYRKDPRIKNKNVKKFAEDVFGEYPDFIQEAIENRTFWVLKGAKSELKGNVALLPDDWKGFEGVDESTTQEIVNIIEANSEKGVDEIARIIKEKVPEIANWRGERIARTETTNAVMGSKRELYRQEVGAGMKHKWNTVGDDKVGEDHKMNDGKTRKDGESFPSGETRPGQRPYCRCDEEDIIPDDY